MVKVLGNSTGKRIISIRTLDYSELAHADIIGSYAIGGLLLFLLFFLPLGLLKLIHIIKFRRKLPELKDL